MLTAELLAVCRAHGLTDNQVAIALQQAAAELKQADESASTIDFPRSAELLAREERPRQATLPVSRPTAPQLSDRYAVLELLGTGGMAEVWRVRDRALNRTMALKTLRPDHADTPNSKARFVEEAQATAQLQHPGILPVHELGELPDGRLYFTMKEVRGKSLRHVIAEVHAVSKHRWSVSASGWTFRRLVEVFRQVCEAAAYAHDRGVVHRDLKPDNVMVGPYGEVLVVDWGLAKVRGRPDLAGDAGELDQVVTDRSLETSLGTLAGAVAGTPAYMPPEQARGEVDAIDARSDVYALGAILYDLLSGRPPYMGSSPRAVLAQLLMGPPEPPGTATEASTTLSFGWDTPLDQQPEASEGPELPPELLELCQRAMARDPAERLPDATSLASEVTAWLDGERKREQALGIVQLADTRAPEAADLRSRAAALMEEADALLEPVKPWQPEQDKGPGWSLQDEAAALENRAAMAELEQERLLAGALTHFPALPEAHAALAARYRREHEAAEAARQNASRQELLLRSHVQALPGEHPDRHAHAAYLIGDGALSLVTDPPGAEVLLHRYVRKNRRLVAVFERTLGKTPLARVSVPMGSYLCILRHPDRTDVRYPVCIGRGEHWRGGPPAETDPHPVWLPRAADLEADDCYIPPGWFWSGGDALAAGGLPRQRLWLAGRVVKRFSVTNREYLAFLNDLVAQGRQDEALRHAPRERAGKQEEAGDMIYGRRADGRFELVADADGDMWLPDYPVCMVGWQGAMAFARWRADRTGLPWRLPSEFEWEKAARGVDGRFYPWGDILDPSWTCMRESHPGRPVPSVVDSFPVDVSPFGVRGMAGGMRNWCMDTYHPDGPTLVGAQVGSPEPGDLHGGARRVLRGGSWGSMERNSRSANRSGGVPSNRAPFNGLRLFRDLLGRGSLAPAPG